MSNTVKTIRIFIFSAFIISSSLFIFSCSSRQAEADLKTLTDLVPQDSSQVEYIKNAILTYNAIQTSITSTERVGRTITRSASNQITDIGNDFCKDTTRAVFFSMSNIFESLLKIDLNEWSTSGIAVVYGKYPNPISGPLLSEFTAANIETSSYNGRSTVVLKYVKNMNSTLSGTTFHSSENPNSTDGKRFSEDSNNQLITNLGMPCPRNCPEGTYQ